MLKYVVRLFPSDLLPQGLALQPLSSAVLQARKLGKSVYLFSPDKQGGKVAHVNFVSPELKQKGVDARTWAGKVTDVLGGKVTSLFAVTTRNSSVSRPVGRKIPLKVSVLMSTRWRRPWTLPNSIYHPFEY